jgi:hypothetical protein
VPFFYDSITLEKKDERFEETKILMIINSNNTKWLLMTQNENWPIMNKK